MTDSEQPVLEPFAANGEPELHPTDYLYILRRRWWLVALAVGVALFLGWRKQQSQIPQYTAEALLQVHGTDPQLADLGVTAVPPSALPDLGSELEILRSHTRLSLVVDSLGTRLQLGSPEHVRSSVVGEARVDPSAPVGSYVLQVVNGEARLTSPGHDTLRATAAVGEWLWGPGFGLRVAPGAPRGDPISIVVGHPLDAVRALRDRLRLEVVSGTNLIRVRYTDTDPVLAAGVPNTLAAIYKHRRAERNRGAADRRVGFIAQQLSQLADSVEAAEVALMRYQQETGLFDPNLLAGGAAAAADEAQRTSLDLRFRHDLLQALVLSLEEHSGDPEAFQPIAMRASQLLPGAGQAIFSRLQDLRAERVRLTASRIGYTGQGPSVEVIDSLISVAKADLRLAAQQALEQIDVEIEAAGERQRAIRSEAYALPEEAMAYARLERQLTTVQEQFSAMLGDYYDARIAQAVEADAVEVVDPATVPRGADPSSKSPLILALLAGLVIGGAGALGLEKLDTKVRRPEDAERVSGVHVIALIPEMRLQSNGSWRPLVVVDDDAAPGAEAFRMLRTTLRFVRADQPRVVAVASTGPSEGKSIVAANLAAVLAQQGAKVLLVDADFRRPVLHEMFGVDRAPGLSDLLIGDETLADATHRRANVPNLEIITCGSRAPHPAELLGSEAFAEFLEAARERYDVVIIDTPPILAVTDATVVGTRADGVLLVAQANFTDRRALASGVAHLRHVRVRPLGLVVNRVPEGAGYGRYGSAYPYLYGYQEHNGGPRGALRKLKRTLKLT